MRSEAPTLEVVDLVKHFPVRGFGARGVVHAVDGVSFSIADGELLGLVGESGSGKSTVANCVIRLLEPTSGSIRLKGRDITHVSRRELRPLRRDMHMVFQDPYSSLDPRMTCGQIVAEPLVVQKLMSAREIDGRIDWLFDRVGLRAELRHRYPHELSGGQRQRIGLARALSVSPALLVADEPVSALDVSVQASILNLLRELQEDMGFSCLFITHDLATVEYLCDRVAVMYLGKIVELSATAELFAAPKHPYTQALLSAAVVPDPVVQRARVRFVLEGDVPSPIDPPSGCRFRTRCPLEHRSAPASHDVDPPLIDVGDGHLVACHLIGADGVAPSIVDAAVYEPVSFTTRPELRGTFGAVASTHWLASSVGMAVLERGGNAFDAACAAGFVLQVVEPHLNGPGGDLPAVFWAATAGEPLVLCAQGISPRAATIDRVRGLGHELMPGTGLLAACVPGAFGGWLRLLRDFGTWRLEDVLGYAIGYAEDGYPVVPGITATIRAVEELLGGWAGSAELYLPAPQPGSTFRNPTLAATYRRIVDEARGGSREEEIERARLAFYEGFVAEEIDRFSREHGGLLDGDDLRGWQATLESPAMVDYRGLTVCKTGAWGQGPAGLQQLRLLEGFDVAALSEVELVHVLTEAAKLAFADRDACYGDSADVPLERLLSRAYADERRALIGDEASGALRPGLGRLPRIVDPDSTPLQAGAGEPTRGDTVHIDVADRFGNLFSATPSGGWLQSSPTIPALGWPLGTRAQMFWLEEGLPSSLKPGVRPRTTLSPGLVLRGGEPWLAYGTPGGDQQEQWALHALVRHVDRGLNLQEAIDAPEWHTDHLIASFYPRGFAPRALSVESRLGEQAIDELRRRGHEVTVTDAWSLGRVTAVQREAGGLRAGANPRGMQGYAVCR